MYWDIPIVKTKALFNSLKCVKHLCRVFAKPDKVFVINFWFKNKQWLPSLAYRITCNARHLGELRKIWLIWGNYKFRLSNRLKFKVLKIHIQVHSYKVTKISWSLTTIGTQLLVIRQLCLGTFPTLSMNNYFHGCWLGFSCLKVK